MPQPGLQEPLNVIAVVLVGGWRVVEADVRFESLLKVRSEGGCGGFDELPGLLIRAWLQSVAATISLP